MTETIFAMASGWGPAGIAIIRISGPLAGSALMGLTGKMLPKARQAVLAKVCDGDGRVLDRGLVLWFPAPKSFTGEDVAEVHLHGGRAVVAAVIQALAKMKGLRLAEPGEFSKRAFLNGRLDLAELEGLADLIAAETEAQRRQALRQMDGGLTAVCETWRRDLLHLMAHAEAEVDFPDEDLGPNIDAKLRAGVEKLLAALRNHLADDRRGERLREGIMVAVIGPVNAGKSSLINILSKRDVAIVSPHAGTTRDVIEVHLDLAGFPIILSDTAGLRAASDDVEHEGIRRAKRRAAEADLKLIMLDATTWPETKADIEGIIDYNSLIVMNKIDLRRPDGEVRFRGQPVIATSIRSGEGMERLLEALKIEVAARFLPTEAAPITRSRHRAAIEDCVIALERFLGQKKAPELGAEDLRLAARALGRISGRIDVEQVLDVIFKEFCLGK